MAIKFAPKGSIARTLMISLDGPSNSGKTYSALVLASVIADGGKVAVVDTEAGRASHYEDDFTFDHYVFDPPYTPEAFSSAAETLEKKNYSVIIWDSASDEYEGIGGLVEMAAAGTSFNEAANWAKPKAAHKAMMARLRTRKCHSIFCLRAEDKIEMFKVDKSSGKRVTDDEARALGKGRTSSVINPIGFQPVCEKRFGYDMAISLAFAPGAKGHFTIRKMTERLEPFFLDGQQVSEKHGKALLDWSKGNAPKAQRITQTNGHNVEELQGQPDPDHQQEQRPPLPDTVDYVTLEGASFPLPPLDAVKRIEDAAITNKDSPEALEHILKNNTWLALVAPKKLEGLQRRYNGLIAE